MIVQPNPSQFPKTACGGVVRDITRFPGVMYKEEMIYFCTRACLRAFEKDKDRFMAGEIDHPLHDDDLEENIT